MDRNLTQLGVKEGIVKLMQSVLSFQVCSSGNNGVNFLCRFYKNVTSDIANLFRREWFNRSMS